MGWCLKHPLKMNLFMLNLNFPMYLFTRIVPILCILMMAMSCQSDEANVEQTPVKPTQNPTLILALGKVEPEASLIQLAAPQGGVVEEVFVEEGDTVRQGQPLVRLRTTVEQSQLYELDQRKKTQRIRQNELRAQEKEILIQLNDQQQQVNRLNRLVESGAETAQAAQDARLKLDRLQAQIQIIHAQLATESSKEKEWDTQRQVKQAELKEKTFLAPTQGVILDLNVRKGESAVALQTFAEFAPAGKWIVRAEVDELFSSKIKTGQSVKILAAGTDTELTEGQILRVIPYLKRKSLFSENVSDQEDRRVLEIQISLKSTQQLFINSKVDCLIRP